MFFMSAPLYRRHANRQFEDITLRALRVLKEADMILRGYAGTQRLLSNMSHQQTTTTYTHNEAVYRTEKSWVAYGRKEILLWYLMQELRHL